MNKITHTHTHTHKMY